MFSRVVMMRRVEIMELASSRDATDGVWNGLLQEFPSGTDWIRTYLFCARVNQCALPQQLCSSNYDNSVHEKGFALAR